MIPKTPSHQTSPWKIFAAALLALPCAVAACARNTPSADPIEARTESAALVVGNGLTEAGEQCDDGNTVSGDGCSAAGTLEAGYLCHVSGQACSLASLCGNNVINPGEACDDGDTVAGANGCSATCGLSLCGNGVYNNRQWPNFDQETCDDGNSIDGDGCSRLCGAEPGFSCTGSPARCVPSGVLFFGTGVDAQNRRLQSGTDPHWFYRGTTTGLNSGVRNANDWPQDLPNARFMAAPLGAPVCAYQDFLLPSTLDPAKLRVRVATFNDNALDSFAVNGIDVAPITVSEPAGQPWQKNIVRELGVGMPWRGGLNRIEICNENETSAPNAFRYLYVDAYVDRCGDGVLSVREDCDDGNVANGDGCSATCGIEPGRSCQGAPSTCASTCGNGALNGSEECDDGNGTNGDGCNANCRVEAGGSCGNGAIDGGELCDDGNPRSGDGCSASCRIERGYECFGVPSTCARSCGNGRLDAGELCDDGNSRYGDGCSNACTFELGYVCPTVGQPCALTCGNGTMNPGELCDDGNLASADGCGSDCRPESGYACSRPANGPSVCAASCGNGALNANETCDDGNLIAGDGCSSACGVEVGYSCSGAPSVCATLCGDGIRAGNETCDDGNPGVGDGCSATCQIEAGWRCPAPGTVCFHSCGNGEIELGESCDDGNAGASDGCDAFCRVEPGFGCSGRPSVCGARCGDGVRVVGESCDDGNVAAGDGCDAACGTEAGFTCVGRTSVCTAACGDGVQAPTEACDDGNTTAGDGCDAGCAVEDGFGCANSGASLILAQRGQSDCTQVASLTEPTLPAGAVRASLTVPGRYRMRYVGGAVSYAGLWHPGVIGANYGSGAAVERFSLGLLGAGVATFDAAEAAGAAQRRDFDADSADVRLALVDTSCALNDNSDTQVLYRVDAMSVCQQVPVLVHPAAPERLTSGSIGGTATPGATVQVTLDGAPAPICTVTADPAGVWSCSIAGATPGAHDVVVSATVLGTTQTAAPVTVILDDTAPAGTVITVPATGAVLTASPASIEGNAEPGSEVTVREDATVICSAIVDGVSAWSCAPTTPLADGVHTITALAVDSLGNVGAPSAPTTFTIDGTVLAAPAFTAPGELVATATPSMEGTAEPGRLVTVREGSVTVCTATASASSQWTCVAVPLIEGAHTVTATASDGIGNESAASTRTFTVDTRAPDTSFTQQPLASTTERRASFGYASTELGARFECSLDGAAYGGCEAGYPVALGAHVLAARSIDLAGNVDASPAEARWTVVAGVSPPDTSPPAPSEPTANELSPLSGGSCSAARGVGLTEGSWLVALGALLLGRARRRRDA